MTKQDEQLRDGMIRFEGMAFEQAALADDAHEPKWAVHALKLAARLCCALRSSLPGEEAK